MELRGVMWMQTARRGPRRRRNDFRAITRSRIFESFQERWIFPSTKNGQSIVQRLLRVQRRATDDDRRRSAAGGRRSLGLCADSIDTARSVVRKRFGAHRGAGALALVALVAFLALDALLVACENETRYEAQRLIAAVDRFRHATNPEKPAAASALRAVPCSDASVCRARDACLASAEATARALRLKSEVEGSIAAVEKGTLDKESDEARALAGKLAEAESLLKEGFSALPACDDRIQELKRRLRL